MNTINISQPRVYPHITYLDKIAQSDTFVVSDDLFVNKNSFEVRNKYYNYQANEPKYLNVPTEKKNQYKDLLITDLNFAQKHRDILRANYKDSPFFDQTLLDHLVFDPQTEWFIDYFCKQVKRLMYLFDITTDLALASDSNPQNSKNLRINEILTYYKADRYLSGAGGKDYLHEGFLEANSGVEVIWHDTSNDKFRTNPNTDAMLMVFDTLFEHGIDKVKKIIHD